MDIFIAFGIIFGVMILIVVGAAIAYSINNAKTRSESKKSMPQGADSSDFARMLQDKYKAERDNGEFKRPDFY